MAVANTLAYYNTAAIKSVKKIYSADTCSESQRTLKNKQAIFFDLYYLVPENNYDDRNRIV